MASPTSQHTITSPASRSVPAFVTSTSDSHHSTITDPQTRSQSQSQPQSQPQSQTSDPHSHSISLHSSRSSLTYSPPPQITASVLHPQSFPSPPAQERRRRHSAYLASHPHPYHHLPSSCSPSPVSHTPQSGSCHSSRPSSPTSSHRLRAFSTSAVHPSRHLRRPHPRWFYGPAPSTCGGPLAHPRTRLEREISRDEQLMQMYGGDAIRDPPPKLVSEEPEVLEEGPAEEGEVPPHAFVSPATTLDVNLVGWDGPDDPENPQNWSKRYKWMVTMICILMTVNVTFASSAPSSAATSVMAEFDTSREVSYLITTMFLLGYVFGPLFWGPGSELTGRKPIFVLTLTLYTIFHLGQALAQNIQTLLITRFFSGFFAVAPLTNCGGVIADIWSSEGRGPATSLFTASVFLGPVLGPLISGFIIESHVSWRWVFWVMMFFAAGCTLITVPFLPETYAPVILLKKVKRLRKQDPVANKHLYAEHEKQDWSLKGVLNRTLLRPFKMLAMEPILVLVTIYLSIVYGLLYALFQAFPIIFVIRHNFTLSQTGLTFIGIGIGTTIGSIINFLTSRNYTSLITTYRGFPPAEYRLIGGMIGSPILVVGIFWLGWCGEYSAVPWYVSGLSTIVVGCGISLIFMSFLSYLVDTYLMYSASAFAANTICRSAVAAAFPLFTVQMFTKLGVNWACTLIGLISLLFLPSPFLFYKYGARIREKSRFAPCIDLKIKKEIEEEERRAKLDKEGMQETKV